MMECQKDKFNIPEDIAYLNCANIAPLMNSAAVAGKEIIDIRQRPYKITREDWFKTVEQLKKNFSQLINCKDFNRIAIIPSVSYGIATVVNNIELNANDEILVVAEQYPSNYYSWKLLAEKSGAKVKVVMPNIQSKYRGRIWNQRILEAISPKTKVVALGNVHWADGTFFDLDQISKKTKANEALLIIDGSQSIGALPFDIEQIKPDALFTVGYKWLLGPFSLGLGYYGEYFDNGKPLEENWINRKNSKDFENLVNYTDEYGPLAAKYNVGQNSNFHLVPILNETIASLNEWNVSNIQSYCKNLTKRPIEELQQLGCLVEEDDFRAGHLFGIRLKPTKDLRTLQELFVKNDVYTSLRGSAVRVSVNIYNDENDMDRLAESIKSYLKIK